MKNGFISKLALACALTAVFSVGGIGTEVYACENIEANYSLEIVAAGNADESGFSAVYGSGAVIAFDALNVSGKGESGVFVASSESVISDSSARKLFAVGFEGGHNYRVKKESGALTVEKSEYRTEKYAPVASFEGAEGSVLGVYVRSDGVYSASIYIDNFTCTDGGGKVIVRDRFDKRSRDNVGTIGKITEKYGFINRSEISYTVSFLTEEGEVIAKQEVSLHNNAALPAAPEKAGYTFKGWTKGYDNVTSDVKCYAVYEEGEEPDVPDDPEREKDKNGCGAEIRVAPYLLLVAAAVIGCGLVKRGGRKDA